MAGRPKGLVVAARDGNQLEALRALRDFLASNLADSPPSVQAQLSGKLMDCLARISELEAEEAKKAAPVVKSAKDEIAERRKRRLAEAQKARAVAE